MDDFWNSIILRIGNFTLTPAKLAGLTALLTITWLLLSFIKQILLRKRKISTVSERGRMISVYQLIKYFTWVLVIALSLTIFDFNISLLVAGSAALLVGIGFGLQSIFSDLISGLFMLFEQKVKVGDIMEVDNIVGKVQAINLRTSVLLTRDSYSIIVPNHKFITENVINWSHHTYDRRFQMEVGVSYGSDVDLVTRILLQCASKQEELLTEEQHIPFVRFHDFGDNALIFYLMFWTQDIFRAEHVKSELRYKVIKAFRENGIQIPYPQRDIHIIQSSS